MVEKTFLYLPMKRIFNLALIIGAVTLAPAAASAQSPGRVRMIFSTDGSSTFLGYVNSDQYDPESICNSVGIYGSNSGLGIYNPNSLAGSQYSNSSAYNPLAQDPPALVNGNGTILGLITKNPNMPKAVDPDSLYSRNCRRR
jgi:hypothetical protein